MTDTQHHKDELTEEKRICIAVMADDVPTAKSIEYGNRVDLVRQERDRALYSIYRDGEHQTTIDADMVPASHRLRNYLDALEKDEEETTDDLTGWH
jgi:hypothetical protein